MKTLPIIYNDQYGFIVDEESVCKTGELYLTSIKRRVIPKTKGVIQAGDKILAYIKLSPASPDIEGLIEVKLVDVEKIAEDTYREFPDVPKDRPDWKYNRDISAYKKRKAFIKGYNYYRPPFPQPTWEDVEAAIAFGIALERFKDDEGRLLDDEEAAGFISDLKQSKLPKEFVLGEDGEIKNGTFL